MEKGELWGNLLFGGAVPVFGFESVAAGD